MKNEHIPALELDDSPPEGHEFALEIAAAMYLQAIEALRSPDFSGSLLLEVPRKDKLERFTSHECELRWLNGGDAVFPFKLVAELAGVTEIELRRRFVRRLPYTKYQAYGPKALIIKRK